MHRSLLIMSSFTVLFVTVFATAQDDADLPAVADEMTPKGILPVPDYAGDLQERPALTGDRNGTRTKLADDGIQFQFKWVQYGQGITSGGLDDVVRYGGVGDYLINLDLDRMGAVPGGLVTFRGESRYGKSVNGQVGTVLPVNTNAYFPLTGDLDDDIAFTITDLLYTQFLSEKFGVFLGKMDTLNGDSNEFAGGRGTTQFMNSNFVFNSALALRLPYSTLGVGAAWMPTDRMSITATLFNTVDSSTSTGFDDFGDGLSVTLEAQFQYEMGGLPGGMTLGGLYSFDQDFTEIGGRIILDEGESLALPTKNDTWAVYWNGWQYLWAEAGSDAPIAVGDGRVDRRGFGLFGRFGVADKKTNPVDWSGCIGIGGRGLFPSRSEDTYGVGYFYTDIQPSRFTNVALIGSGSQGIEAYYDFAITNSVNLTLDAQFIDPPYTGASTAIVLGARLGISF